MCGSLLGCRAASGWPKNRVLTVLGRRAEVAAHARFDCRAGSARGTNPSVLGRSRAVLFRAISVPTHRPWPI
jgi:hypothetical protein